MSAPASAPAAIPLRPFTASRLIINLWAVGAIADYLLYYPFNALIKPVFTTVYGLDPRAVGWALMATRLLDGVLDPLLGTLSDNTRGRWGRRRPYLLASTVLGVLALLLLWQAKPTWGSTALFFHLLVTSCLLFVAYGTYSMTHVAFGYELSDDYYLRTKVIAVRAFYFSLAAMAGGWLYNIALWPGFGGELNGVRWVTAITAGLMVVAGNIPVLFCRERFESPRKPHINLFKAVRTTLRNRAFVVLLLLRIAKTFGGSLYGQLAFYIGVYSICLGDKRLYTSLSGYNGMLGFALAFLMVPLSAELSRRVGKRSGLVIGQVIAFAGACSMPFFNQPGRPYLLMAQSMFIIVLASPWGLFMDALMPDICDIDELESGERREGLYSSVNSFINKMENSLCILAGGYLLTWSGFSTDLAKQNLPQPDAVLEKLRWMGFAPAIFFAGLSVLISLYMPINHRLMAEVRAKLDARRAAAPLPA